MDQTLGAQFLKNESPSIVVHAVLNFVDLLAVSISWLAAFAMIRWAGASLLDRHTFVAAAVIAGLISFLYLALTQGLCGRTFGMMLTNTRVVDSSNFEPPSFSRALLRTFGYLIAAAPAMLGFICAALDHKRRGWHDHVSGTLVVRDF